MAEGNFPKYDLLAAALPRFLRVTRGRSENPRADGGHGGGGMSVP